MQLKGLKAIVTGGSKGIGKGIVQSLLTEGCDVLTFARDEAALKALEQDQDQATGKLHWLTQDACDVNASKNILERAQDKMEGLDILVNNLGGVSRYGGFFELEDEDFLNAFELNVMTMLRFTRAAVPLLRESASPRIINISLLSGSQPGYYNPHYALTKAATINLSKYFSNILSSENILVNTICPGPVHSDAWDRGLDHFAAQNKNSSSESKAKKEMEITESAKIPLGRIGEPEDIAGLVVYLSSKQAQ